MLNKCSRSLLITFHSLSIVLDSWHYLLESSVGSFHSPKGRSYLHPSFHVEKTGVHRSRLAFPGHPGTHKAGIHAQDYLTSPKLLLPPIQTLFYSASAGFSERKPSGPLTFCEASGTLKNEKLLKQSQILAFSNCQNLKFELLFKKPLIQASTLKLGIARLFKTFRYWIYELYRSIINAW